MLGVAHDLGTTLTVRWNQADTVGRHDDLDGLHALLADSWVAIACCDAQPEDAPANRSQRSIAGVLTQEIGVGDGSTVTIRAHCDLWRNE